MNLKKIKYTTFFVTFFLACPLFAFSQDTGKSHIDKKSFMIADYQRKRLVQTVQKSQNLIGSWQSSDGSTIIFLSDYQLDYNDKISNYTLIDGVIRLVDNGKTIDYKYILNGNSLLINFPEGYSIKFHLIDEKSGAIYSQSKKSKQKSNKVNKTKVNCNVTFLPAAVSGNCKITLITPAKCEEINLANGKSYQFAWQTGGSFCETPYKLYIYGNPATDNNSLNLSFPTKAGEISSTGGGTAHITAKDISKLKSNNGLYHWVVYGWYGSHPASQTFRVKK